MKRFLVETESKQRLEAWGMPTVPCQVAHSPQEAVALARAIGFPVVLKILSPDILHKTDAGGVELGLETDQSIQAGYDEIIQGIQERFPSANILGVTVQKQVRGIEVIIGVTRDSQFGPVLMFGMGGIWVELLQDTVFRLIPIRAIDAAQMVREIKGFPLLQGYRGQKGDIDSLAQLLVQVSEFVVAHPEVEGMDLNPVITSPSGSVIADARIVIEPSLDQAN